jgi:hypothetical protein
MRQNFSVADMQSGATPAEGEVGRNTEYRVLRVRVDGAWSTDFACLCSSDVHFWHTGR